MGARFAVPGGSAAILFVERAEQFAGKLNALDSAELRDIFRDRAFLYPGDVAEDLAGRPLIFLEGKLELWQKSFPGLFV